MWKKKTQNNGLEIVSKTFRRELKIDFVWQQANEEEKGR